MHFDKYLEEQLKLHPSMRPQDFVKMCYQAARGAEHLLKDITAATQYFEAEYSQISCDNTQALYEEISPNVCRVNLGAWKASGMPSKWLFQMFVNSASITESQPVSDSLLKKYLLLTDQFLQKHPNSLSYEHWEHYLIEYKENGMPSVHHSDSYREVEKPAYRIVHKRFIRLLPILEKAAAYLYPDQKNQISKNFSTFRKDSICIAIDGRAASGKSTMADDLKSVLGGGIIHMDDFFLPPAFRTAERFAEPGGNVHYERFAEEVLPYLSDSNAFSYRTFDCGKMDFGDERFVEESKWKIIEGAYSHHPYFKNYADIKVFSDVSPTEQMERIRNRNGEYMAQRFANEWIPMEETYYNYYQIKENADMIL